MAAEVSGWFQGSSFVKSWLAYQRHVNIAPTLLYGRVTWEPESKLFVREWEVRFEGGEGIGREVD